MKSRKLLTAFAVLLSLILFRSKASAIASLVSPISTIETLDGIADPIQGVVKWSHGAFIYQDSGVGGAPPTFHTLDRDGRLLASVTASFPDGEQIQSCDFDRGQDGVIAFVGSASLALLSADGSSTRVISTAPYHPYMVSVAPDGTVWTVGLEFINGDPNASGVDRNAGALRHFDHNGRLLGTAFPQSEFVDDHKTDTLTSGFLVATKDRLGWYSSRWASGQEYMEVATGTMTKQVYKGLAPDLTSSSLVAGFCLTDTGKATLTLDDHKSHRTVTYSFDRAANQWTPLPVPPVGKTAHSPRLLGHDGDLLVFGYGNSASFVRVSE